MSKLHRDIPFGIRSFPIITWRKIVALIIRIGRILDNSASNAFSARESVLKFRRTPHLVYDYCWIIVNNWWWIITLLWRWERCARILRWGEGWPFSAILDRPELVRRAWRRQFLWRNCRGLRVWSFPSRRIGEWEFFLLCRCSVWRGGESAVKVFERGLRCLRLPRGEWCSFTNLLPFLWLFRTARRPRCKNRPYRQL